MMRTHAFNLKGAARKPLIEAIESFARVKGVYQGAPKFGYAFMGIGVLDKEGALHFDCDMQVIMDCVTYLEDCGFACDCGTPEFESLNLTEREELGLGQERRDPPGEDAESLCGSMQASDVPESYTYQAELSDPDCPDRMEVFSADNDEDAIRQAYEYCEGEGVLLELFELDEDYSVIRSVGIPPRTDRLTIEVPLDGFTPEKLDNLFKMVNAKASLLKAALGTDSLPIKQTADTLLFPWFRGEGEIDEQHTNAYAALVSLMCKTAIEKKRVTAKEKDVDGSTKYAMRCFLLSVGMIGSEYKAARKILLSRLEGNSSWKNGAPEKETEMNVESVGMNSLGEMLADAELIHAVNASFEIGGDGQ